MGRFWGCIKVNSVITEINNSCNYMQVFIKELVKVGSSGTHYALLLMLLLYQCFNY